MRTMMEMLMSACRGSRPSRAVLPLAVVGMLAAVCASPVIAASLPVEAVNEMGAGCGYGAYTECHHWSNAAQTIIQGEKVTFSNPYSVQPYHGLKFTAGSPSCTGLSSAIESSMGALGPWKGECAFNTPGTYTFVCTVHPSEMKGTITVTGTPKDATTPASGANQTEAVVNGSIAPEGNAIEYHFEYGVNKASENMTPAATISAGSFTSQPVSSGLKGLLPNTTYHFLLVAVYGTGKTAVSGATELTFTTPAAAAPTVEGINASVTGEHEATLEGRVDPNGGSGTEYFFEYATTAEYEATKTYSQKTSPVTGLPMDNTKHAASTPVPGLQAGTAYRFRLVAKNSVGTASGEGAFTTLSPLAPKEPVKEPAPTPTPTPTPGPISPQPELAPLVPPLVEGSLKLTAPRHGSSVRGSLEVSKSGAGGRLEVDLIAKSASLARRKRGATQAVVGRLVRASVSAGKVSFSVALNARGKSALRRHHRLALTVKITLTPHVGKAAQLTRGVVLHA